jgi:hypothetical protein
MEVMQRDIEEETLGIRKKKPASLPGTLGL